MSLQPHYNLLERPLFEGALEDECVKEGIGVIPYWPLAAGFLSGKYRSEADLGKSPRGAGVKKYLNDKGLAVLKALDAAAKKHNASNVTVALAWLMQRKSITAPIVSATSLEQLKTLVAAPALKLDAESVAALDKASASAACHGGSAVIPSERGIFSVASKVPRAATGVARARRQPMLVFRQLFDPTSSTYTYLLG